MIPYKIQKGDTLKGIYKLWGMSYLENAALILALNPGKNPDKLSVGEIYNLPTTENNLKTNTYTTVMSHVLLKDESPKSVFARYGIDFSGEGGRSAAVQSDSLCRDEGGGQTADPAGVVSTGYTRSPPVSFTRPVLNCVNSGIKALKAADFF